MQRPRTLYLNNSGSRWIVLEKGVKPTFYVKDQNGNYHLRTVLFFEAFGNWVSYYFCWKGRKISGLPEDTEEHNGKPILCERESWQKVAKNSTCFWFPPNHQRITQYRKAAPTGSFLF